MFVFTKTNCFTFVELSQLRRSFNTYPDLENIHSHGTDVARQQKRSFMTLLRLGKLYALVFHNSSALFSYLLKAPQDTIEPQHGFLIWG